MYLHRTIYVNVDSPNLGFTYFNFLGGYQLKKNTLYILTSFPYISMCHIYFKMYEYYTCTLVCGRCFDLNHMGVLLKVKQAGPISVQSG